MVTQTETTALEQIRAVLADCAAAITAKDARRAVAHHAPDGHQDGRRAGRPVVPVHGRAPPHGP